MAGPVKDRPGLPEGGEQTPVRLIIGGQLRDRSGRSSVIRLVAVVAGGVVAVIGVIAIVATRGVTSISVTFITSVTFLTSVAFVTGIAFVTGVIAPVIGFTRIDTEKPVHGIDDIVIDVLVGELAEQVDGLFTIDAIVSHRRRVGAEQARHRVWRSIGLRGFGGMGGIQIAQRTGDAAASLATAATGLGIIAIKRGRGCIAATSIANAIAVPRIHTAVPGGGAAVTGGRDTGRIARAAADTVSASITAAIAAGSATAT